MLQVTFQQLSRKYCLYTVVFSNSAAKSASKMGYSPILDTSIPVSTHGLVPGRKISAVIVIGADIIDGSYNEYPLEVLRLLSSSVKDGAECVILGSSSSKNPNPEVTNQLRALDNRIRFYARDVISQERFTQRGILGTILSADIAFLLSPRFDSKAYRAALAWKAGSTNPKIIVALNIHYALFGSLDVAEKFATDLAGELVGLSKSHSISWVILPHDYRYNSGDVHLCRILYDVLHPSIPEHVWTPTKEIDCGEAKAIVSLCDAAVTGRMHLAIAALGMKVPALCLDYQDKFEGLLCHFKLPSALLIKRENLSINFLRESVINLISNLATYRQVVAERHSGVMALARKNFE